MSLARGLVWCKSCQVRTALADAGGKCPVCDPDQGNRVSKNAETELERIDAVLAGSDTHWEGAEWHADGSHEDEELLPWQDAFLHRRMVPNPMSPANIGRGGIHRGLTPVRVRASGGPHGGDGWREVGFTPDVTFGFDGSRDDDTIVAAAWPAPGFTVVLMTETTQFTDALMQVLFGFDLGEIRRDRVDLARWEDDGGPVGRSEDFFDV